MISFLEIVDYSEALTHHESQTQAKANETCLKYGSTLPDFDKLNKNELDIVKKICKTGMGSFFITMSHVFLSIITDMTHKLIKGETGRPEDELGCWMLKNLTLFNSTTQKTELRNITEKHVTICAPVKSPPQGK